MKNKLVAILGASAKEYRYSNMAMKLLIKHGYRTLPIHPSLDKIDDIPVYYSLVDSGLSPDTITTYVNPIILKEHLNDIIKVKPRRVILNPGTEDDRAQQTLENANIMVQEACTLVLLKTGQFEIG